MLLQRCVYADDLPYRVEVFEMVTDDSVHYHLDTEILCLLKGKVHLRNGYCHYELQAGDIFTNSAHEVHQLTRAEEGTLIARIHINTHYFSQFFPDLSKACYRTYTRKEHSRDRKYERLRELLFQLLLKHAVESSNSRNECIRIIADLIKVLDQHFNLFSIDKDLIVGIDKSNWINIARISRICQYIYQHYDENITLNDLSQMEHLNSFYLSHLIKELTGMSFRDLLCLARVEMSEILLLDTDDSVSSIAKAVGFSTTAYYEKFFTHWFRHTPSEHRALYSSQMRSELDPIVQKTVSKEEQARLVRQLYAAHRVRIRDKSLTPSITLNASTHLQAPAMAHFSGKLSLAVTTEDYRALGSGLVSLLSPLHIDRVLVPRDRENPEDCRKLVHLLRAAGYTVCHGAYRPDLPDARPGNDTLLLPVHLLRGYMSRESASVGTFPLRDKTGSGHILQGGSGLVTAQGIKKPVYYMLQMLSGIEGDIICRGNQYCVLRESGEPDHGAVRIFVYHCSGDLDAALHSAADKAELRSAVNEYMEEVTVEISIKLPMGLYAVEKFELSKNRNIFAHLSAMDFRENCVTDLPLSAELYAGAPTLETYVDDVRTVLSITFSTKGVGLQGAIIRRIPS